MAMQDEIGTRRDELAAVCLNRRVRTLTLFGSAATGGYKKGRSDFDFAVVFERMPPSDHADAYFGLLQDLEEMFGSPVDLVEFESIANPYFKEAVQESQVLLYAAA